MVYREKLKTKNKSRTFASNPWWSSKNRFDLPLQTARKQQNTVNSWFQTLNNREHGTTIPHRREINKVSNTNAPFPAWRQLLDHWFGGKTQQTQAALLSARRWSYSSRTLSGKQPLIHFQSECKLVKTLMEANLLISTNLLFELSVSCLGIYFLDILIQLKMT